MNLKQITPCVPVGDMARAIAFYEAILGFECGLCSDNYAYIFRDHVAIRLIMAGPGKDMQSADSQLHCYIDVEDVDSLYAELQAALKSLPQGRVKPPFDTAYGQREFHVIDEDVTLLTFGMRKPLIKR